MLRQGGEADDVGEQDRDDPPLIAAQPQVGAATRAEPSAVGKVCAADRAGHAASVRTASRLPSQLADRPTAPPATRKDPPPPHPGADPRVPRPPFVPARTTPGTTPNTPTRDGPGIDEDLEQGSSVGRWLVGPDREGGDADEGALDAHDLPAERKGIATPDDVASAVLRGHRRHPRGPPETRAARRRRRRSRCRRPHRPRGTPPPHGSKRSSFMNSKTASRSSCSSTSSAWQ